MEMLINIASIIGILIIIIISVKILVFVLAGVLYLWGNSNSFIQIEKSEKKKGKNKEERNKEKAQKIIGRLEDILMEHNIKIPSDDREGNEDEACIYGHDYYELEDYIIEILEEK